MEILRMIDQAVLMEILRMIDQAVLMVIYLVISPRFLIAQELYLVPRVEQDDFCPQIIFDTYNRQDFTSELELQDLTDQTIQNKLFVLLDPQTLFLLMKPPKELFLPTEFNKDECKRCLAFMYGSFNISELKDYFEQNKIIC